jgi:hypothetical protein
MKDSHDHGEPGMEAAKREQGSVEEPSSQEDSSRRGFLRKAGLAGAAAGLTHFVLLGNTVRKAYAYPAACGTTPSTVDACVLTAPGVDDDVCDLTSPDLCIGNGVFPTDVCNPPLVSPDKCVTGAPAYDNCTAASPDVPLVP